MLTLKYMFFLHYVKSAVENEFEIRFIQFDLFRRKSAFSTQNPLPVKTKARSRDVTGGTKILRNTFPTRTGVTARVSSSRSEDVFSEESDSNALGLVYDSDGNNPESLGESGPHPGSLTICAA